MEIHGITYPIGTVIHVSKDSIGLWPGAYMVTETSPRYGRMLLIPIDEYKSHTPMETVLEPKQPRYTQLMKSYGKERK